MSKLRLEPQISPTAKTTAKVLPRYSIWILFTLLTLLFCLYQFWILALITGGFVLLGIRDRFQHKHSILRNYPIIGHMRFVLEEFRPEIRQYFIESDTDELPFSREQRALVYQRAKQENDTRAFGTISNLYEGGSEWRTQSIGAMKLKDHDFRIGIGGKDVYNPTRPPCLISQP